MMITLFRVLRRSFLTTSSEPFSYCTQSSTHSLQYIDSFKRDDYRRLTFHNSVKICAQTHSSFSELLLHENVLEPLSQSHGRFELGYLSLIPEKMA